MKLLSMFSLLALFGFVGCGTNDILEQQREEAEEMVEESENITIQKGQTEDKIILE